MFSQSKRAKMNEGTKEINVAEDCGTSKMEDNLVASGVPASVTVALHPLVIMNISDHFTRIKAQQGVVPKVFGALLGKQNGRHIELYNSFELQHSENEEGVVIEMEYFRIKEEQFRQVFSDLDFLGWYTVGSAFATEQDIRIQKQLTAVNEGSLLLKLDPISKSSNLPITIYESMIDIVEEQEQPRMLFIKVQYTLVTEEAERIGVDHVARLSSAGHLEISQVSEYMQVQQSAIKMLSSRINIILQYVKAVKAGEIPLDQNIMRQCLSLIQRLPVLNTPQFKEDFYDQCSDVTLMSFLATITKGCSISNEVLKLLLLSLTQIRYAMLKNNRRGHLSLSKLQSPITTQWLNDNYQIEDGVSLPRSSLYTHYMDFCTKNSIVPVNAASFGKIIRNTFPNLKTRRLGTRGQSKYHYYGITVKKSSPYYEMVMLEQQENAIAAAAAAAAALIAAPQTGNKLKEECDAPPKKRVKTAPTSTVKSSTISSSSSSSITTDTNNNNMKDVGNMPPATGTLLPEFPSDEVVETEDAVLRDKVKTFLIMYKAHCQRILDTILRANFAEVQNFLIHFWQGIPSHITVILTECSVVDLIGQCDNILYKAIGGVLIPSSLQPLPASLTQAIQQFAKELSLWLEIALFHLPEDLQRKKLLVAKSFSQQLVRQTSLSHLAQAARTVMTNGEVVTQMAMDFQEIPAEYLIKQVLWISSPKYHARDEKIISKFIDEMLNMLEKEAPIEEFTDWLSSMIMKCVVKPSEKDDISFQALAQDFLLKWSFITSKIVQELTLRSAKSFGSFHLLQMLFDDFIFYKIESHADISEEIEDIVPDNRPSFNSKSRAWMNHTTQSPTMMFRSRFNPSVPATRTASSYPSNYPSFNYPPTPMSMPVHPSPGSTFPSPYDEPTVSRYSSKFGIANTAALQQHPAIDLNSSSETAGADEVYYSEDLELVRQLQERTKSLMDASSRYTEESYEDSPYSVYNNNTEGPTKYFVGY